MCGIVGLFRQTPGTVNPEEIRRTLDRMRHRGPDDEGYLAVRMSDGKVVPCGGRDSERRLDLPDLEIARGGGFNLVLGHRRLSIIDLSESGHQPMASADSRFWIVYNGELYNYVELRAELAAKGHPFRTETDTEVILAAYREWGAAMLGRFIGMFAFAILDLDEAKLFMARDFFGIKPLYYAVVGNQFAFASEIKAVLEIPGVARNADPQRLYEYLRFANTDHGDRTMFSDVRQLPPAHWLSLDLRTGIPAAPTCYWRIDLDRRLDISFEDAVARVRDLFSESIRLHLRSDVPVGSCLSGGLDSSSIVAWVRRHRGAGRELHTFSYIAEDPVRSEEKYVDLVTAEFATIRHKVTPSQGDIEKDLEALVHVQEQPFMGTSIYAQYRVFRQARDAGIKVMLDGQGADEIFAGYYHLIGARITSLIVRGKAADAWRIVRSAPENMRSYRLRMLGAAFGRMVPVSCTSFFMRAAGQPLWPPWLNREWFVARGVDARQRPWGNGRESLREELLHSIGKLNLPNLLRYEDRNSMCHSIESRVPFCNPKLAEFALSLPEEYLIARDGDTKSVFRHAMRGIVPDAVLDREKVGFTTPERKWLDALLRDFGGGKAPDGEGDLPFLREGRMREMFASERRSGHDTAGYTWRCLNVIHWARIYKVGWV